MPSQFGGDQCSKEYAPHMWIGNHFIGGTGQRVTVGKWVYYAGRTSDETLVVERHPAEDGMFSSRKKLVPDSKVPTKVREVINKNASSERQEEVNQLTELFNKKD